MAKQSKKGEIVEDYCKRERYLPTLTLVKKIMSEHKALFKTLENTRDLVRIYRGEKKTKMSPHRVYPQLSPKSLVVSDVHSQTSAPQVQAKILILDIETAPLKGYLWGIWNQNISPFDQLIDDWFILCWSAKWLFEEKIYSGKLNKTELSAEDDKRIMKEMWRLMEQADIIITHNGERFDLPKLNTRFLVHGMTPTMPYQSIDTLRHVRKRFSFTSNKLDYICMKLGLRRKIDTGGFELWKRCANGDTQALGEMSTYCDNDVLCLEELYLYIRPWINPHPNIGLFIAEDITCCPCCGGLELIDTDKMYRTQVSEFRALRCGTCGSISRSRKAWNTGLNKSLIVSVPK